MGFIVLSFLSKPQPLFPLPRMGVAGACSIRYFMAYYLIRHCFYCLGEFYVPISVYRDNGNNGIVFVCLFVEDWASHQCLYSGTDRSAVRAIPESPHTSRYRLYSRRGMSIHIIVFDNTPQVCKRVYHWPCM